MDKGQRKNDQEIFRDKIFIQIVIKCFAQKGKTNFLRVRERVVDSACLNCCLLKFTTKRLRTFLLWKLYDFETVTKPSFEQHFWTFKIIFTVLKKSPQLRKASVEVGKFSFVFSQNNSVKQRVQEKMYR